MSSPIAASTHASMIQQIPTSPEQKPELPDPFKLDDYQILHKVYLTHVNDDEKCDKDTLSTLVSNIILGSTQISGTSLLQVIHPFFFHFWQLVFILY